MKRNSFAVSRRQPLSFTQKTPFEMGNSLSTRFEWNQESSLQTSVVNQEVLYEVVAMIEQLALNYGSEAKAEFRSPLVWTSKVLPTTIASSPLFSVKEAGKGHKGSVVSIALKGDGQPFFSVEQNEVAYKAKVYSFEYLAKFLEVCFSDTHLGGK